MSATTTPDVYPDMYVPFAGVSDMKAESASEEKPKKSSFLIRPEDITDAADSTDLLEAVLSENLERIADRNDLRKREQWAIEERGKIYKKYELRAAKAYQSMWDTCAKSSVGHDFITVDVKGYTIETCQVCSWSLWENLKPNPFTDQSSYAFREYEREKERKEKPYGMSKQMNTALVDAMKKRMIEVDEEAGILVWPTADDYDPTTTSMLPTLTAEGNNKVKKWFGG